jgi:glycosyltransferase involved in cell wall biosynthesis
MRCPRLDELPAPPPGKTGWPWTEECQQLPDLMSDGSSWPRISIVTPSLNQGKFIEETIRSALLQGYPDLEFIIIDGGSTDSSGSIISNYEKWLTFWVSEPDNGQPQAINKGLKRATGEIVAWINSDDFYTKEAFSNVAEIFATRQNINMIYGDVLYRYEEEGYTKKITSAKFRLADMIICQRIPQPTCFWQSKLFRKIGYLDESYHYIFDLEYWIRAGLHFQIEYFPILLACFRMHAGAKSQESNRRSTHEGIRMFEALFSNPHIPTDTLKLKNKVLQQWYERLAFKYFEEGRYQDARLSFRKAILHTPYRLQNLILITCILDSFLSTNYGKRIRNLSSNVRSYFKNQYS